MALNHQSDKERKGWGMSPMTEDSWRVEQPWLAGTELGCISSSAKMSLTQGTQRWTSLQIKSENQERGRKKKI